LFLVVQSGLSVVMLRIFVSIVNHLTSCIQASSQQPVYYTRPQASSAKSPNLIKMMHTFHIAQQVFDDALINNDIHELSLLLNAGFKQKYSKNTGHYAIETAIKNGGSLPILKLLIEHGINPRS